MPAAERDWRTHWNALPTGGDLHAEVGKTRNGVPIDASQVGLIVENIVQTLQPNEDDWLLDLCCGNGLLTAQVAQHCRGVVAIDYSAPLIESARRHHARSNIHYVVSSVLEIRTTDLGPAVHFGKAFMYEALQYFSSWSLGALLAHLASLAAGRDITLLLASIPDRARLFDFYDTPERRAEYERRSREGTEAIGTWWDADELVAVVQGAGYDCQLRTQPNALYTAHYRFDALLNLRRRRPSADRK